MAAKRGIEAPDIALHIRKGDLPREISDTYTQVMARHFPGARIRVFTEFNGDSNEILQQLGKNHELEIVEGGDALDVWLQMARAKVLFIHQSSYSDSAAIASEGIVFSQVQKPQEGRYDGQTFFCPTVGGWWISYGHGTTHCDEDKLRETEQMLSRPS